jgi:hypothetical protein
MSGPMDYLVGLPVLCRIDEDGRMSLTVYAEDLVEAIAEDGASDDDRALAERFLEGGTAFDCVPTGAELPPIDGAKPELVDDGRGLIAALKKRWDGLPGRIAPHIALHDVRLELEALATGGHPPCNDPGCREHGIAASNRRQSEFYATHDRTVAARPDEDDEDAGSTIGDYYAAGEPAPDVRQVMRSIDCPTCGAKRSEYCRVPATGAPCVEHAGRYQAAFAAGLLPLQDPRPPARHHVCVGDCPVHGSGS